MNSLVLLTISIVPVLVLLQYFDRADKIQKEPFKLKFRVFKWGMISITAAIFIEISIASALGVEIEDSVLDYFIGAFIVAALVEEILKFFVVKKFVYDEHHFNEILDGILYTIIASLGFALVENIFYVFEHGIVIGILRAFLSVPGHALFSGVMGYYIAVSKLDKNPKTDFWVASKGIAFAVFYHGTFNFLLSLGQLLAVIVILMPVMIIHLSFLVKKAKKLDSISLSNKTKKLDKISLS